MSLGMFYNSYNERKGESLGCIGVEEKIEEIREVWLYREHEEFA